MSLKLPMDFAKDCILMIRITEDGSFILVEFRLQCTDAIKVREVSGSGCKKQVFDQQFSEKLVSADFGKQLLHILIDKAVMRQRAAASLLGA